MINKTIIFIVLFNLIARAYSQDNQKVNYELIQETVQKIYFLDNRYEKAMNLLERTERILENDEQKSLSDIIDLGWLQIQLSLYEHGFDFAFPHIKDICNDIMNYYSQLPEGFSIQNNTEILMLSDKLTKNLVYFSQGTKALHYFYDCFIEIYNKESNNAYLNLFKINKADIYILEGRFKKAYDIVTRLVNNSNKYNRITYSITYGSCLLFYKKNAESAIKEFQNVVNSDDKMIKSKLIDVNEIGFEQSLLSRGLLMTLKLYRETGIDLSGISEFEKELKTKYKKNYYKKPEITKIGTLSQAKKIGLKVGDLIESYENELVYDGTMFRAARMSEKFNKNVEKREIIVNRNGMLLKYTINPGLIGVQLNYY